MFELELVRSLFGALVYKSALDIESLIPEGV
jgi:hypothetical protein